jgi:hypothetical protein
MLLKHEKINRNHRHYALYYAYKGYDRQARAHLTVYSVRMSQNERG